MSAVAEFVQVSKRYAAGWLDRAGVVAVEDVSFRIKPGEVFGLLGPNRAGKTTLVKLLLSLARPTSGQVLRLGAAVENRATLARVGFVHESQAFPRYLSAAGLLEYFGTLAHLAPDALRQRIPQLLKRVELSDRSREPIARFSKGMVQRLALAQAMLNDPELLVLDEPSEGLDLAGRQLVRYLVQEQRRQGKSVLFVSHVTAEAEKVCDRVAVMVSGRLAYVGPLEHLTRNSAGDESRSLDLALRDLCGKKPALVPA